MLVNVGKYHCYIIQHYLIFYGNSLQFDSMISVVKVQPYQEVCLAHCCVCPHICEHTHTVRRAKGLLLSYIAAVLNALR